MTFRFRCKLSGEHCRAASKFSSGTDRKNGARKERVSTNLLSYLLNYLTTKFVKLTPCYVDIMRNSLISSLYEALVSVISLLTKLQNPWNHQLVYIHFFINKEKRKEVYSYATIRTHIYC